MKPRPRYAISTTPRYTKSFLRFQLILKNRRRNLVKQNMTIKLDDELQHFTVSFSVRSEYQNGFLGLDLLMIYRLYIYDELTCCGS